MYRSDTGSDGGNEENLISSPEDFSSRWKDFKKAYASLHPDRGFLPRVRQSWRAPTGALVERGRGSNRINLKEEKSSAPPIGEPRRPADL